MSKMNIQEILRGKIDSNSVLANCGVYFLLRGERVVYIGSSRNVLSRISVHKKDKDFDSHFVVQLPEDELLGYETECIAQFTPEYNRVLPNCERYKYLGIVNNTENKSVLISAVIIGGKIYVDSMTSKLDFSPQNSTQCQY